MSEQMTALGEHGGFQCFWGPPGEIDEPGFYIQSAGRNLRIWEPYLDTSGETVVSINVIPWEPGMRGLAVELSNGVSGAFRLLSRGNIGA